MIRGIVQRTGTYFSGNVKTVLNSYKDTTVLTFGQNCYFYCSKSSCVRQQPLKTCVHIWKLGAARFPLHQGPITDSPPCLSMAPVVMAVARRAATSLAIANKDVIYPSTLPTVPFCPKV